MKYVINGKFMADRMQGIVRYAREITNALDSVMDDSIDITLAVPSNAVDIPAYKHIKVKIVGTNTGIKWEQTELRRFMKQNKDSTCIR